MIRVTKEVVVEKWPSSALPSLRGQPCGDGVELQEGMGGRKKAAS
jgi:hypothetical protein